MEKVYDLESDIEEAAKTFAENNVKFMYLVNGVDQDFISISGQLAIARTSNTKMLANIVSIIGSGSLYYLTIAWCPPFTPELFAELWDKTKIVSMVPNVDLADDKIYILSAHIRGGSGDIDQIHNPDCKGISIDEDVSVDDLIGIKTKRLRVKNNLEFCDRWYEVLDGSNIEFLDLEYSDHVKFATPPYYITSRLNSHKLVILAAPGISYQTVPILDKLCFGNDRFLKTKSARKK